MSCPVLTDTGDVHTAASRIGGTPHAGDTGRAR